MQNKNISKTIILAIFVMLSAHAFDNWNSANSVTSRILTSVVWGMGKFVAIGPAVIIANSTSNTDILYSDDGQIWSRTSVPYYIKQVIFADSQFVAVGNGVVYVSKDAKTWVKTYEKLNSQFSAITVMKDKYLIIGDSITGSHFSLVSEDCKVWTRYPFWQYGRGLITGQKVIALYGSSQLYSTDDGVVWNGEKTPLDSSYAPRRIIRSLKYLNGKYFGVGDLGSILISTNGNQWDYFENSTAYMKDIVYGSDRYVAVADSISGAIGMIYESNNGVIWNAISLNKRYFESFNGIAWGNGRYVVVGNDGIILYSEDLSYVSGSSSSQISSSGSIISSSSNFQGNISSSSSNQYLSSESLASSSSSIFSTIVSSSSIKISLPETSSSSTENTTEIKNIGIVERKTGINYKHYKLNGSTINVK